MALVYSDNKGFTLIELMVSVVILTVGLLALLQSVNLAINHNMVNELRLEGTQVADEELAKELAKGSTEVGFAAISTTTVINDPNPRRKRYVVRRTIPTSLNAFKNYSITKTGVLVSANSKQVTIAASWRLRNLRYTQSAASLITKTQQ
jgi:type IV pilus assembly protein PilV